MDSYIKHLQEGTTLLKVRGADKWYHRHFKLDYKNFSIVSDSKKWWSPVISCDSGSNAVKLTDVTEIREDWKTDVFNQVESYLEKNRDKAESSQIEESLSFSLILPSETLDLVAPDMDEKVKWVVGLRLLLEEAKGSHRWLQYDAWIEDKFKSADKDNNNVLGFDEVTALLADMHIKMDKQQAKKLFNDANVHKRKRKGEDVLDQQEFAAFYKSLNKMPEMENLFKKYAHAEKELLDVAGLREFFSKEQNTLLDDLEAEHLIQMYEPVEQLSKKYFMAFEGFYQLLLSASFNIYNSTHQSVVNQDMTQPLSHYYIKSSHNTYLLGHQLAGESSIEGYIAALKTGCKLVELDLWDGDNGQPIIYHGHTLTTKIYLEDVLRDAIEPYAFCKSPYPLILSIENHLSLPQQKIMVSLMKSVLKDNLLTDSNLNNVDVLPSPEFLKNKIIVKAKKPQGDAVESDDEPDDDQENIEYIDSDESKKHHKPLAPELGEIVNVCEGKKFTSFESSLKSDKCVHFPSLRENKAHDLRESHAKSFVEFTQRQIAKIYPLGTRTDSSNLKPYPFWAVGAQVVTLNMQTADKANFYNEALFRRNGNCGYVLKPSLLLSDAYDPAHVSDRSVKVVKIRLLSGQHLPPSERKGDIVDPYVLIKVRGHPEDEQKHRSSLVKNNGFNPVWNEQFELKIKVPEIALVYFSVRDESSLAKDPVLALACIPFSSLCTGYRHVYLTDLSGKLLMPAALFVHVEMM